jgi:hypothetical protein
MFALAVMAAVAPSFLCFACSAYMVVKDKAPWKYFAAFGFVAGYGGIHMLDKIGIWRLAAHG